LVIASMLLATSFILYRYRRSQPWFILCFLFFLATVVMANLQIDIRGYSLEPLGFLVLLIALGSLAAGRAFDREQRLKSVEYELETARRIQNSILPSSVPSVRGLLMTARYEPMTAVAGDFYDFIAIDDRRLTVLVADVSGHGVPAALIASMLKVAFGAQKDSATNPAEVLKRINAALHGTLDREFVTAACAHIDLAEGTMDYAGAGHPPSLLWKNRTGELVELAANGLLLGPFAGAQYHSVRHPMDAGDFVLFYTDGLVEGISADGQQFGEERLRDFLRANTSAEPAAFVDRLLATALAGVREDDVTVVLVKIVTSNQQVPRSNERN
jgi:serine phosphatase RsbU (regulator of sigma subunit)